jgi:hypothetical protein
MTNGDKGDTIRALILIDGRISIVDTADFPLVSPYRWRANPDGYVLRTENTIEGKRTVYLHRFLLDAPDGWPVDHKDGNPFDNRRRNLRITTPSGNSRNRHYGRRPAHGVANVQYRPDRPRSYHVRFRVEGHQRYFGSYTTLEEAAKIAAKVRRQLIAVEERKAKDIQRETSP